LYYIVNSNEGKRLPNPYAAYEDSAFNTAAQSK